jgi:hypothetical protein
VHSKDCGTSILFTICMNCLDEARRTSLSLHAPHCAPPASRMFSLTPWSLSRTDRLLDHHTSSFTEPGNLRRRGSPCSVKSKQFGRESMGLGCCQLASFFKRNVGFLGARAGASSAFANEQSGGNVTEGGSQPQQWFW